MRPSAERGLLDGERKRLIMAQERDDLVYLAKLAEQAERFDRLKIYTKRFAASGGETILELGGDGV